MLDYTLTRDTALDEFEVASRHGAVLDENLLNEKGVCLMKLNRTKDAAAVFRQAVTLQVSCARQMFEK